MVLIMGKIDFLKQLALMEAAKQKVVWNWKFGISKSSPENYILKFESSPISSKIFIDLVKFVSKEQYKFPIDDLKDGEETEIPMNAWIDYESKLLTIFPIVKIKKEKFVSYHLKKFVLKKVGSNLVILGDVGGLRVC